MKAPAGKMKYMVNISVDTKEKKYLEIILPMPENKDKLVVAQAALDLLQLAFPKIEVIRYHQPTFTK